MKRSEAVIIALRSKIIGGLKYNEKMKKNEKKMKKCYHFLFSY